MSRRRGVHACRVDTDADNGKILNILKKNGFAHCGTIWFDNSEKVAFDKVFWGPPRMHNALRSGRGALKGVSICLCLKLNT